MLEWLQNWLSGHGVNMSLSLYLSYAVAVLAVLFLAAVANYVAKHYILSALNHIVTRSSSKWDDAILSKRTLRRLSNLPPALVVYMS